MELDISSLKLVHTSKINVRWRDLDDFGHVNNSVYLTYFEQARVEWWLSIGDNLKKCDEGPVIVTAECTFLKPLFHPAKLKIHVHAGLPGRSSYMVYYEIFPDQPSGEKIAIGSTKVVWINYPLGKSLPLPKKMRDLLENK